LNNSVIAITGIGLTAPGSNNLADFRQQLLDGKSGVQNIDIRHMGTVPAGVCDFDELKYQKKKILRRGTRAGSISIYCAREAIADANIDFENIDRSRVGVYLGITEHGNVETENEIHNISQYDNDVRYWTHHHNPRTVANNPAGEVTLNMNITGPHYTIGAACAAGNAGLIQAVQMLQLNEVDLALAGGISESIGTFGIFAAFKSQGALAMNEDPTLASRPLDKNRNGIVVSEGGCIYTLERLEAAEARGAKIYGTISGYAINSDATDFVLANPSQQAKCIELALKKADLQASDIDIVNTHSTATPLGDIQECKALRMAFADCPNTYFNNTKGFIGHCMGAAGALELAGNLPAFEDGLVHPCKNLDDVDPDCALPNLVASEEIKRPIVKTILNNSFGMLGINSVVIVKRFDPIN
jgi:3-oxoacyl-[acyl-carrier-protein] synthase II